MIKEKFATILMSVESILDDNKISKDVKFKVIRCISNAFTQFNIDRKQEQRKIVGKLEEIKNGGS